MCGFEALFCYKERRGSRVPTLVFLLLLCVPGKATLVSGLWHKVEMIKRPPLR